jgi:hypothetical protein
MAGGASRRIVDLIRLFRISPGPRVNLAKDFDPAFEAADQATPARKLIQKDA